jgi:DNA-binding MarR family transcriptional regulator
MSPKRAAAGLFSLLHAAGAAESHVEGRLAVVGLSLPKLAVLHHLVLAGEALPLGELAGRLACVKSNVTQLIDRLEADGLVRRAPDPNDRRSRLAVLTASGLKAHDEGSRIQLEAEQELFGALTLEESRQLAAMLGKLDPHST